MFFLFCFSSFESYLVNATKPRHSSAANIHLAYTSNTTIDIGHYRRHTESRKQHRQRYGVVPLYWAIGYIATAAAAIAASVSLLLIFIAIIVVYSEY